MICGLKRLGAWLGQWSHRCWSSISRQVNNYKKPALTRVQKPTSLLFCASLRWPFDLKINGFPGLVVEHFYVKFGDPSRRQTNGGESPYPAASLMTDGLVYEFIMRCVSYELRCSCTIRRGTKLRTETGVFLRRAADCKAKNHLLSTTLIGRWSNRSAVYLCPGNNFRTMRVHQSRSSSMVQVIDTRSGKLWNKFKGVKTFSAMRERYEAKQRHCRLQSRSESKTVNK